MDEVLRRIHEDAARDRARARLRQETGLLLRHLGQLSALAVFMLSLALLLVGLS